MSEPLPEIPNADHPRRRHELARRHARVSAVLELLDLLGELPTPPAWVAAATTRAEARLQAVEDLQVELGAVELPEALSPSTKRRGKSG